MGPRGRRAARRERRSPRGCRRMAGARRRIPRAAKRMARRPWRIPRAASRRPRGARRMSRRTWRMAARAMRHARRAGLDRARASVRSWPRDERPRDRPRAPALPGPERPRLHAGGRRQDHGRVAQDHVALGGRGHVEPLPAPRRAAGPRGLPQGRRARGAHRGRWRAHARGARPRRGARGRPCVAARTHRLGRLRWRRRARRLPPGGAPRALRRLPPCARGGAHAGASGRRARPGGACPEAPYAEGLARAARGASRPE